MTGDGDNVGSLDLESSRPTANILSRDMARSLSTRREMSDL